MLAFMWQLHKLMTIVLEHALVIVIIGIKINLLACIFLIATIYVVFGMLWNQPLKVSLI